MDGGPTIGAGTPVLIAEIGQQHDWGMLRLDYNIPATNHSACDPSGGICPRLLEHGSVNRTEATQLEGNED